MGVGGKKRGNRGTKTKKKRIREERWKKIIESVEKISGENVKRWRKLAGNMWILRT